LQCDGGWKREYRRTVCLCCSWKWDTEVAGRLWSFLLDDDCDERWGADQCLSGAGVYRPDKEIQGMRGELASPHSRLTAEEVKRRPGGKTFTRARTLACELSKGSVGAGHFGIRERMWTWGGMDSMRPLMREETA